MRAAAASMRPSSLGWMPSRIVTPESRAAPANSSASLTWERPRCRRAGATRRPSRSRSDGCPPPTVPTSPPSRAARAGSRRRQSARRSRAPTLARGAAGMPSSKSACVSITRSSQSGVQDSAPTYDLASRPIREHVTPVCGGEHAARSRVAFEGIERALLAGEHEVRIAGGPDAVDHHLHLVDRARHDHQRERRHDQPRARAPPDAQDPLNGEDRQRDRKPLEGVVGEGAARLEVHGQGREWPHAQRHGLPVTRRQSIGQRGRHRERGQGQHDRPPGPVPGGLAAGRVGLGGELPRRVGHREDEVVERGYPDSHRHGERAGRRPDACAPPAQRLHRQHDQGQSHSLPRLQPAHQQRARRRKPECARGPCLAPALEGEEHERHQKDRDGGHQIAPEVLHRPHLARDEVERVLARLAPPAAPGHEGRGRHHGEQHQQEGGVAASAGGQVPAHVQQRTGERHPDGHRLPQQIGERHRQAGDPVHQARQQEARVQERAAVGLEVVAIADQPVLGGLAYPGEVLQLV